MAAQSAISVRYAALDAAAVQVQHAKSQLEALIGQLAVGAGGAGAATGHAHADAAYTNVAAPRSGTGRTAGTSARARSTRPRATGMATIRVYPTCNTSGQCADPLPLTLEGGRDWLLGSPNDNEFRFTVDAQGALLVHYEVGHSMGRGWSWRRATRPAAEGTLRITRDASGRLHVEPLDDTDAFPSLEAVQWRDGTPEPRLQQRHRGSVRMVDLLDELAELGPWDPRRQPTPP